MEANQFTAWQWPDVPAQAAAPAPRTLGDITEFDRSTKVTFICAEHARQGAWRSKDPYVSSWFPADDAAYAFANESGNRLCGCPLEGMTVIGDYPAKEWL
jgi:hypothetical protein